MEDIDSSPTSPNPRKRAVPEGGFSPDKRPLNVKGTQFIMPTPPDTDQSSNASPAYAGGSSLRDVSPAPSNSTLTSIDVASPLPCLTVSTVYNASEVGNREQPLVKRRKLTPAEKEEQQREKESKAADRAEQKAKREEEKRTRDEEKRRKAEEREAKKRDKEIEEEKKNEAKLKKERSQMRLGAFFQKPATSIDNSSDSPAVGITRRKSLSLEPFDALAERMRASASPCKPMSATAGTEVGDDDTPLKPALSDYCKYFLPFQLQTHSYLPEVTVNADDREADQAAFDHIIHNPSLREKYDLGLVKPYASLERQFAEARSFTRGLTCPSMRQLVEQIQGTSAQPIDLTKEAAATRPTDIFHSVPRRHIQFEEDIRPAYSGTYTKITSPRSCAKLRRNPFFRGRQDTDYDYDSEAEWQEEEEGEDLMDEDDDEADSIAEADEMEGFLDDEDDSLKIKRKQILGDLIPSCTGLCWENESGELMPESGYESNEPLREMRPMRAGILLPGFEGKTIDPFSTVYWQTELTPAPTPATSSVAAAASVPESPFVSPFASTMAPPRQPLHPRPNSNGTLDRAFGVEMVEGKKAPITNILGPPKAKPGPKAAPKTLSSEDLEEFKEAVVGSQSSKADLLKGLKIRFPKITNETIKGTLGECFAQVGASKADKKWVYIPSV